MVEGEAGAGVDGPGTVIPGGGAMGAVAIGAGLVGVSTSVTGATTGEGVLTSCRFLSCGGVVGGGGGLGCSTIETIVGCRSDLGTVTT